MAEAGMMPAGIRLPLVELSEAYHEEVRAAMRQAGL
jgi:4-hydroxy-tetrahydrodipicolinate synthase